MKDFKRRNGGTATPFDPENTIFFVLKIKHFKTDLSNIYLKDKHDKETKGISANLAMHRLKGLKTKSKISPTLRSSPHKHLPHAPKYIQKKTVYYHTTDSIYSIYITLITLRHEITCKYNKQTFTKANCTDRWMAEDDRRNIIIVKS